MTSIELTIQTMTDEVRDDFERSHLSYGHGTETAWDEAAWLVLNVLGISPQAENPDAGTAVSQSQAQRIRNLARQRIETRKPLAYLLNSAWFCGLEFYVDERVVVPRSPIAELIGTGFAPWLSRAPQSILDVCCGSACIAVACALQFPSARVDATDISDDALDVARVNVDRYTLAERVQLFQADVFKGLPQRKYDLIVSNPPYVDAGDMAVLPPEYRNEPELALAGGPDGLDVVRRLLHDAGNFLAPEGVVVCEVGDSEQALNEAFPHTPFIWLEFDYGGHGVFVLNREDLKSMER